MSFAASGSFLVALYTSAWIEMIFEMKEVDDSYVALYTSAWIEISESAEADHEEPRRTLHECVD